MPVVCRRILTSVCPSLPVLVRRASRAKTAEPIEALFRRGQGLTRASGTKEPDIRCAYIRAPSGNTIERARWRYGRCCSSLLVVADEAFLVFGAFGSLSPLSLLAV